MSVRVETKVAVYPANLAELGVPRKGDGRTADILTVWSATPNPVISNYLLLCELCKLRGFGGGKLSEQIPGFDGYILSGYRDLTVDGNRESGHRYALALDFQVTGIRKQVNCAQVADQLFNRIGLYLDRHFIHVDQMPDAWIRKYNKAQYWIEVGGKLLPFATLRELIAYAVPADRPTIGDQLLNQRQG